MQRKISLIGIVGTGKTYLSTSIATRVDGRVLSFGGEVYALAEAVKGRPLDKKNSDDRTLLTSIGTAWGRRGERLDDRTEEILSAHWAYDHGYENIWVDAFARKVDSVDSQQTIINDDLRFPNELARAVLQLGFVPCIVMCASTTRSQRLGKRGDLYMENAAVHESEKLAHALTAVALERRLLPVIWNDEDEPMPAIDWAISVEELNKIIDDDGLYDEFSKFWRAGWEELLSFSNKSH